MYTSIVILVVLASILMCLIVLVQESKGGGLAADYSSFNQMAGAPKTTNFIEKATWGLAIVMIVLSVMRDLAGWVMRRLSAAAQCTIMTVSGILTNILPIFATLSLATVPFRRLRLYRE